MSAGETCHVRRITVAGPPIFSMMMAEWMIEKNEVNARFWASYLLGLKLISGIRLVNVA